MCPNNIIFLLNFLFIVLQKQNTFLVKCIFNINYIVSSIHKTKLNFILHNLLILYFVILVFIKRSKSKFTS